MDWTNARTQSQSMPVADTQIAEIGAIVRHNRRRIVGESQGLARRTLANAA